MAILAWTLVACASDIVPFDSVITQKAPLCKTGPGQFTADTYLEKGTRVRILEREDSYCKVETVGGEQGFVPSDYVGQAEETSPSTLGTPLR